MSPRVRTLSWTFAALVVAWALALGGLAWMRHLKVTPAKLTAYLESVDFARLSPGDRLKALRKLATMLNALTPEERRQIRRHPEWAAWFGSMTDEERGMLLELTLPTGFGQMLTAFEQLPEEKRRQAVDETVRRLREDQETASADEDASGLSPEMRDRLVALGVKSFMEQGSPETRVQLQPVLEEMQRAMESGRLFRPGRRMRGP